MFEKGLHELHHDEEAPELVKIITDWVKRRIERAHPVGVMPAVFNGRFEAKKKFLGKKRVAMLVFLLVLWHLGILYKLYKSKNILDYDKQISKINLHN